MAKQYIPDAGEIVWINFTPHAGHEQAGRRPALVLSPAVYNGKDKLDDLLSANHADQKLSV